MKLKKALLVVDVQNDFTPRGALGVPQGDRIIPVLNKYIKLFSGKNLPVFASRDWHPKKTTHFKKFGGVWPVHCLQDSAGAAFHPTLRLPQEAILLYKGMDPAKDSYSAFQAEDSSGKDLLNLLRYMGIEEIYVAGLATDYCVKFSSIDAIKHGLKVNVLADAIKGVNLLPEDSRNAIKEMASWGVKLVTKDQVVKTLK